jgi:hypothetical protein
MLVQLPPCYKLYAPLTIYPLYILRERNIKVFNITLFSDSIYELKKGFSD